MSKEALIVRQHTMSYDFLDILKQSINAQAERAFKKALQENPFYKMVTAYKKEQDEVAGIIDVEFTVKAAEQGNAPGENRQESLVNCN